MRILRYASVGVVGLAIGSGASEAADRARRVVDDFLSHRATYDLALKSTSWSANVSSLDGRLVSEFDDVCEGFTFNQRLVTSFTDAQGKLTASNLWISTYESANGNDFRFTLSTNVAGASVEQTAGSAARGDNGAVNVAFEKPRRRKLDLTQGVVFPTEFVGRVVAAAKAGKRSLSGRMFEGDSSGQVYDAFVAIGLRKSATAELDLPGGDSLEGLAAWPVAVSYYAVGANTDLPEYETSFTLFENGVTSEVTLDYGSYALTGRLRKIERLAQPKC